MSDIHEDIDLEVQITVDIIELQKKQDKIISDGNPDYLIDLFEQTIVRKVDELKLLQSVEDF